MTIGTRTEGTGTLPRRPDGARRRPTRLVSIRFRRRRDTAVRLSEAQRRYVEEVKRRLTGGGYPLHHGECPCGSTEGFVVSRVDRYGLPLDTVLCAGCGTLRFDPYLAPEPLSDFYISYYQEMYARVTDPDTYFARQQHYGRRLVRWAQNYCPKGSLIVEVGCGAGGGLHVFQESGYRVMGCDYSEPLLGLGRERGVRELYFGGLDALAPKLVNSQRAALIFLHHVFEHIAAPIELLLQAKGLLAEDGLVVIAVPDVTRIDRFPFPNGNLRLFLHIAHKFNYTIQGLEALARRAGLEAWKVGVEESTQAPEIWVAFGPPDLAPAERAHPPFANGEALFRHLRSVEWRFVGGALLERLGKPFGYARGRPAGQSAAEDS